VCNISGQNLNGGSHQSKKPPPAQLGPVSLTDLETAVQLMRKTRTRTGLRVTVELVKKYYATGQKYSPEFRTAMPLEFDEELPAWNYRATPGAASDLILN